MPRLTSVSYTHLDVYKRQQLTGAYIDQERGALKVPDVSPDTYPPSIDIFEAGVYHVYDYQFFYRNLQENVGVRLAAYMTAHAQDAAA